MTSWSLSSLQFTLLCFIYRKYMSASVCQQLQYLVSVTRLVVYWPTCFTTKSVWWPFWWTVTRTATGLRDYHGQSQTDYVTKTDYVAKKPDYVTKTEYSRSTQIFLPHSVGQSRWRVSTSKTAPCLPAGWSWGILSTPGDGVGWVSTLIADDSRCLLGTLYYHLNQQTEKN